MRRVGFFAKFAFAGVLIFALLSFNWDRIELENRAFVIAIGIDAAEDGGFDVSMSIVDPVLIEGGEETPSTVHRAQGETLARAMGQINAKISDKVYYGHTKAVILGESVLEDEKLMGEVVDTISRNNEINTKSIIMATDKAAAEILEKNPGEHSMLGVYLSSFYNSNNVSTASSVVKLDFEGLRGALLNRGHVLIPKITITDEGEEGELKIGDVAVLKGFALVGYIDEEVMHGFLWLMEDGAGSQIAVKEKGESHTLFVDKSAGKVRFEEQEGRLVCRAKVTARGSISGACLQELDIDGKKMAQLEEQFAKKIKEELLEIFYIFQSEFGVDGFGLQERLRKAHWPLYLRHGHDWEETFAHMVFVPEIEVNIRDAGVVY